MSELTLNHVREDVQGLRVVLEGQRVVLVLLGLVRLLPVLGHLVTVAREVTHLPRFLFIIIIKTYFLRTVGINQNMERKKPVEEEKKKADFECPICLEIIAEPVRTPCNHLFCLSC